MAWTCSTTLMAQDGGEADSVRTAHRIALDAVPSTIFHTRSEEHTSELQSQR